MACYNEDMVRFDTSAGQEQVDDPLLRPVYEDMVECERMIDKNDSQFTRRTFYRAAFAYIDANVYWLKSIALDLVVGRGSQTNNLNVSLVSALLKDATRVGKTGKIKLEPNKIPFLNNLALVLRSTADCIGLDSSQFFSDSGWDHLSQALQVRHRITHPKKAKDMIVTDSDMDKMRDALTWFTNSVRAIARQQGEG